MGAVRYILALSVFFAHFNTLQGYDFFFPVSSYTGVGGFFALSGFLIYGSYLRKANLKSYVISRATRILPAYWATVILFASLLCLVSDLGIGRYFSSPVFYKYLISNLAFLNFIQPELPGVFGTLPVHAVNGSLWTMKVEWLLYLSVPVVANIIGKFRLRQTLVFAAIYAISCLYRIFFLYRYTATGNEIYNILGRQFLGQMAYFYCGVLIYKWYDVFKRFSWQLISLAALSLLIADYIPYYHIVLHPLAVTIIVIGVSMTGRWGTWFGRKDNISYNIYLVHFPVIQLCVYCKMQQAIGLMPTMGVALLLTILISACINRCVEKPVIELVRKRAKQ